MEKKTTLQDLFIEEFKDLKIQNESLKRTYDSQREEILNLKKQRDFYNVRLITCEKFLHLFKFSIVGDMIKTDELVLNKEDFDKEREFEEIMACAQEMARGEWSDYDEK